MKKSRILLLGILGIIFILSVAQVIVANRLSTNGIQLEKYAEEIKKYQKENAILSEKVLTQSSLTKIASNAASLGFVDSKSQFFLSMPLPLAVKR